MDTKRLSITIVIAAVTVVLNPAISGIAVPAPYAPFLIYQLWEIPIVVACLLIGFKYGASILLLNTAVLLAIFPGASPTGPIYNLAASSSMLLGIYIAKDWILGKRSTENKELITSTMAIILFTIFGIIFRVAIMSTLNYFLLAYPPPIGYSMPPETLVYWVPLIAVFNATLALYTIPTGAFIAKEVNKNLRLLK